MKKHTKIYLKALRLTDTDRPLSELSGRLANDLHHIECKGMGGDPTAKLDRIENLIALTREEHLYLGDQKQHMEFLYQKHLEFLIANKVKFDREYMEDKINQYYSYSVKI